MDFADFRSEPQQLKLRTVIRPVAAGILCSVMRVVARSAHDIPDRSPIQLEVGERVEVGERDKEWPAFVFVTTRRGSGWVPERHLAREGSAAVIREPYDTTELPTHEGEELEVILEDQRAAGCGVARGTDETDGSRTGRSRASRDQAAAEYLLLNRVRRREANS